MKNIAILGSTGSIGQQALEVIDNNPDRFAVEVLTANNNVDLLIEQAKKFHPNAVVIANEEKYDFVRSALAGEDIKVYILNNWFKFYINSIFQANTNGFDHISI